MPEPLLQIAALDRCEAQQEVGFRLPEGDRAFHHLIRDPGRRLRLGFVSPDFMDHCQAYFTLPLLAHLDRRHFEVYAYGNVARPDGMTAEFQRHVDRWRDIAPLPDAQAEALVRADRVDVLIDLTLHMGGNRIGLFARKPAPVQLSYLGYPGTTGLETFDGRITDPYLDPPDRPDRPFVEPPLRLPRTFWCYRPPVQARVPPKAPGDGPVVFGSLNNPSKLNEATLALWAAVLAAVPDATLVLLAPGEAHRARLRGALAARGIAEARLTTGTPIHRASRVVVWPLTGVVSSTMSRARKAA